MAALQLNLSDDVKARLQARAKESGYETVEQYAQALLQASAEDELLDDDVEALLIERLEDPRPGIELTPQFKEQFREQINQRRRSRES
jgi:hypothetical protein